MMKLIFLTALLAAAPAVAEPTPPPPFEKGAKLTEEIRAADSALFGLVFDGCDPARLRGMVTDSMEFYHDKGGQTATSGDDFVRNYKNSCEDRMAPDAWRSRRELVAESLDVDPVPGFGAMEVGEHLFYERKGDGPEKLVGRAGFAMVWKWDEGVWKLHRVLSFGHKPVE